MVRGSSRGRTGDAEAAPLAMACLPARWPEAVGDAADPFLRRLGAQRACCGLAQPHDFGPGLVVADAGGCWEVVAGGGCMSICRYVDV